ncbi:hypothetical protein WJX82_003970 [Trebouxia sp. C0006]
MWVGMSFPEEELAPDFEEQTLQFIAEARQFRQYKAFIAEADGKPAGSVSCQLFGGLYPLVFAESARKLGYIWGVFVEPEHRKKGLARQLTHQAILYLQSIGCTRIVLHASAKGTGIYKSLGFVNNNEMKLDLTTTLPQFPSPVPTQSPHDVGGAGRSPK